MEMEQGETPAEAQKRPERTGAGSWEKAEAKPGENWRDDDDDEADEDDDEAD